MEEKRQGWKTRKETWERDLSWCSDKGFYHICTYTSYITNLYVNISKLPNHLKYVCCICLFWINSCSVLSSNQSPMDWESSWPKFYLRFYYCHILCSFNWRRLWELHFKLRRYAVSVRQKAQIFNQEQWMIFLLITANPTKRKGLKNSFQKNSPSSHIKYVNQTFNISDIFITIGSGRTKKRRIRATQYFWSLLFIQLVQQEQRGKKLTKARIVHLGCIKHLFGADMSFLGLYIGSVGLVRP